jgi:hypothetical protein
MQTLTGRIASLLAVAAIASACATGGGGGGGGARTSAASGGGGCPAPPADVAQVVNKDRGPVDPGVLGSVSAGMCMADVLARLGPAHRDAAAGGVVLSWNATDGRTLEVGAETLRAKATFVRWTK